MNIATIQTFLAVTRLGNLNRAAEQLNVTQSAVTSRLDGLEAAMGVQLLTRARSGATLTKAGYAFLDQAELIATTWSNARARASLPKGVTRMFSLVCDPALWVHQAEPWLTDLRTKHPETAMDIWAGLPNDAQRWVQSGMSDAALLTETLKGPDFAHRVFAEDHLVQYATLPRAAVAWDPTYIFVNYGQTFRTQHAAVWPGEETASVSFSNPDWALAHMLRHGGSTYLPEKLAEPHVKTGQLYPVAGAATFRQTSYLNWRKTAAANFPWLG